MVTSRTGIDRGARSLRGKLPFAVVLAHLSLLLASGPLLAAGTAAGTVVENSASVEFNRGGEAVTEVSNLVTFVVAERLDVVITPQTPQLNVPSGALGQALLYTVTNLGNGSEAFLLAMESVIAGDDFDPVPVVPESIFFDTDGSGDFNTGDVAYSPGSNDPVLAADESVDVLLLNDIPVGLANGDLGRSELRATAVTGSGDAGDIFAGQGDGGIDAVAGLTGATATSVSEYFVQDVVIDVIKSQSVLDPDGGTDPVPGATISYVITIEVTSAGTATASYINDPIPTWTSYSPGSMTLNGNPISDETDGDAGEFDTSGTPAIVVRLGDLTQADGLQSLAFQVTID